MEAKTYKTKLLKKEYLTQNILVLRFEKPAGFSFTAGQFVQFLIPAPEKQVPRSYSISSAPGDDYLEFCVKLYPDGVASIYFNLMDLGQTIEFRGPLGRFTVEHGAGAHYFIATGAGIAPVMGMIKDELEYKSSIKEIRLLFGVRSEEDVFWQDRFQTLNDNSPLFLYDITLSQPKGDAGWKGLRGRVTEHVLHHLVEHTFYLCGSAAMVKDVRHILMQNGVNAKQIKFEIF